MARRSIGRLDPIEDAAFHRLETRGNGGVPVDAGAYKWINFTMRPEIAARITRKVGNWSAARGTEDLVDQTMRAQFNASFPGGAFHGINWYPAIPPGLEAMEGRILDRIKAAN